MDTKFTTTVDSIFEHGFFNFISLTVFTILACSILTGILIKNVDRHKIRMGDTTDDRFLKNTIRFLVWAIGILSVFDDIRPLKPLGDTLLGASGILAIGFTIAAQTALSNYVAGFVLAVHKPFKVGDSIYLKEQKMAGIVREITFRHTCIETKNGTMLTIPNSSMNSFLIEDISIAGYTRTIDFKVSGDTDFKKMKTLIYRLLAENDLATNKTPNVTIDSFDGQGYTVVLSLSSSSMVDYTELKNAFIPTLMEAFKENGIHLL